MTLVTETAVYDSRAAFADELIALAATDPRIVAVCNDSVGSSNLVEFRNRFPDRLIDVGIAEQTMVGVGAGLANAGLIPFVCAASPFLTGRALEQIKVDVAYSQLPVILCGMSPGVAYGELGPTHHSIEDLSWLRALPGLDIVIPADRNQTRIVVRRAAAEPRPMFIRVGRVKVPDLPAAGKLERGRFQVLREGHDATIIAAGTMVSRALDAADALQEEGVSARVVNAVYVAPLDLDAIRAAASETSLIVTAEEANLAGGLGAAVASVVVQLPDRERIPVEMLGFHEFTPTGNAAFLYEQNGLTADGIVQAVRRVRSR